MIIRKETPADRDAVLEVVRRAFQGAEHSDGREHELVAALRGSPAFVPELSLVAEADGAIVGYVLFTKIQIASDTELALAPLAVLPAFQGRGVGSALVREGHRIAADLGYRYSVVLGSERYYLKFGYVPAERFGILPPFAAPSHHFMAVPLSDDHSPRNGVVTYAAEFGL